MRLLRHCGVKKLIIKVPKKALMVLWVLLASHGCAPAQDDYKISDPPFGEGQSRGMIENDELNEASGLTASIKNAGMLWSHNDSGDEARVFLMDNNGRNKAVFYLEGVVAKDWEEIGCIQRNNESYLLVGDIGDNTANRTTIRIHLVKEPRLKEEQPYVATIPRTDIVTFVLRYEDGPRDSEAFFYDPLTQKLYVVSKRELQVGLYETELPAQDKGTLLLKKTMTLPYNFITSACISADGKEVLLKNLLEVFYWKRSLNESIPDLLKEKSIKLPYKAEVQGEAIAFARDGSGYFTVSEEVLGLNAYLIFYPRR